MSSQLITGCNHTNESICQACKDKNATYIFYSRTICAVQCPKCGLKNIDNWPIEVNGKIVTGGCQMCWEKECDVLWWNAVEELQGEVKCK